METKFTKGKWVNGWGNGLTGPTTPSCEPFCDYGRNYIPISIRKETIAVVPLPESGSKKQMKANVLLISKAPEMFEMLERFEIILRNGYVINKDHLSSIQQLLKEATEI